MISLFLFTDLPNFEVTREKYSQNADSVANFLISTSDCPFFCSVIRSAGSSGILGGNANRVLDDTLSAARKCKFLSKG